MYILRDNIVPAMPGRVKNLSLMWEELIPLAKRKVVYRQKSVFTFPEGEKNSFGYIRSGQTATLHLSPEGDYQIGMFIGEGCLFHESYILAGFCEAFPQHQCLTDVELYLFDGNMLLEPSFRLRYPEHMFNAMQAIAIKAASLDMLKRIVGNKTVAGKAGSYLYTCALIQKTHNLVPEITQIELALMLRIHKSSLNRVFLNMVSMGIINGFSRKRCTILDMERLKAVADGEIFIVS